MDDDADRSIDGEGNAVDKRMGDADRLDSEGSERELFLRRDFDEPYFVEELVLFKLAFNVGQRELGSVDGHLEFAEDPGQSADVIFMAMGKDDGTDEFPVLRKVGDVGYDDVNAEEFRFRKHEAGVDHDDVVFPADRKAIHAEFAEAAERDNFQLICLHLSHSMLTGDPMHWRQLDGSTFGNQRAIQLRNRRRTHGEVEWATASVVKQEGGCLSELESCLLPVDLECVGCGEWSAGV
jgi:hypothetical protein